MKKILFPTDFSPAADNALAYALAIAKAQGASLLLMHTYRLPLDYSIPPNIIDMMEKDEHAKVEQALMRYAQGIKEKQDCQDVEVSTLAVQGFTSETIAGTAKSEGADLIVMGTKGASGVAGTLLGSMTSSVIGQAHCPLLVVPESAQYKPVSKILYASDFSPSDYPNIHQLLDFGKKFKASVVCVHISEDEDYFIDDVAFDLMKEQYIEVFPKEKVEFRVLLGSDLAKGMEEAVEHYGAEMMAMTTYKRSFISRLFSPSQSKKMAIHTKIPLLVFQG